MICKKECSLTQQKKTRCRHVISMLTEMLVAEAVRRLGVDGGHRPSGPSTNPNGSGLGAKTAAETREFCNVDFGRIALLILKST